MIQINASAIPVPSDAFSNLNLSDFSIVGYFTAVKPLVFFIIGMTVYAIFIFKFYKFLARRDMLQLKLKEYSEGFSGFLKEVFSRLFHTVEILIVIPLLVFFWFAVLAVLLLILAKNQSFDNVLLSSMALVATVRITAYYKEELSRDIAKVIPLALLAIFLIDASYFSIGSTSELVKQIPSSWQTLVNYLIFVIGLELVLRTINALTRINPAEEKA
jgi:hypothetical protein